ncbi:hypothetical protein J4468_04280 [Candidatus Woesearchaeota archaeon]|nr:hypothetical protein [Candidatus Woesearchaeota archaeon]
MNIEHYRQLEEKIMGITYVQGKITKIIKPGIYHFIIRKLLKGERHIQGLLETQLQNIEQTAKVLNTINHSSRTQLAEIIKDYDRNLKELYEYSRQEEELDIELYNLKIAQNKLSETKNQNKFLIKNKKMNLERTISEKTHIQNNLREYIKAKEEEESIIALEEKYQRRTLHWSESFQNKLQLIYSHLQRTRNLAETLSEGNNAKNLLSDSIGVLNLYVANAVRNFTQGIIINPDDHNVLIPPETDVTPQTYLLEAEDELIR